jgi:acylphosphatase
MTRKRVRATVHGRVQGVAFRQYTRREAERLGVSGWVKNQSDGTVAVVCEGEDSIVDALVAWLSIGSPHALVQRVECHEEEPQGEAGSFTIRISS